MASILKIENRSRLSPKGQAVLLLPYEPDLYHKDSKIIVPDSYKDKLRMVENRGVVLAIGPEAWLWAIKNGAPPRAQVGEKVMVSKYAGYQCRGIDGLTYRMVNADDIFCGIDDDLTLEEVLVAQGWDHKPPEPEPEVALQPERRGKRDITAEEAA